jgi:hypothetical protein
MLRDLQVFNQAMKFLRLLPFITLVAAQKGGAAAASKEVRFSETPRSTVSFGISIPKAGGKDFIGRIVG